MNQLDTPFIIVALALSILVWSLHFILWRPNNKRSRAQLTPGLRFSELK